MPELPNAPKRSNSNLNDRISESDRLRALSRSPHPYHHLHAELLHPSERVDTTLTSPYSYLNSTQNTRDADDTVDYGIYPRGESPRTPSDSGTEADDEHFLKGLPAPRLRPHKGLREGDGTISAFASPLPSPAILKAGEEKVLSGRKKGALLAKRLNEDDPLKLAVKFRRKQRAEITRRVTEVLILGLVGTVVISGDSVRLVLKVWEKELSSQICIFASLTILYPLRLAASSCLSQVDRRWPIFSIPAEFDPAPLLYPPWLTMFVATLLSPANPAAMLPNILLGIASLPQELIPGSSDPNSCYILHWFLTCLPLFVSNYTSEPLTKTSIFPVQNLQPEILVLLYPLHQALCVALHYLTTTSLLRAELQLLSIALINVLLLSSSPQVIILKSLLWGGGIGMFVLCAQVLKWVVALARVPKWRFRRASSFRRNARFPNSSLKTQASVLGRIKSFVGVGSGHGPSDSEDENVSYTTALRRPRTNLKVDMEHTNGHARMSPGYEPTSAIEARGGNILDRVDSAKTSALWSSVNISRRHTLPNISLPVSPSSKRTPSGRRKRSASSTLQSFFSLTERQAYVRKWLYASYVYACVLAIILGGIRPYVGKFALGGSEPIGWALGYLCGNLLEFRMKVVTNNLDHWICLPGWSSIEKKDSCRLGWVEHLRYSTFGPANSRLILCVYWLGIIVFGLAIVLRLSAIYEVDTRRKVFHFMMVAMLLPATYVDPPFAALALVLILAIFLLLDLFRASQLPPLSKPLASFLTPYVDGRDLRGPVVISHIFLLIGCAIPLWLSLGAVGRTGTGCWTGWDVPTRDVSMVAGVICVGMGDAAASLIGRRYGRHKWFWPGGKSLEGSIAFATAVCTALGLAKAWLRLGGWTSINEVEDAWTTTAWKSGLAASVASLTEAVLTGGNDNVVVPVVLWLCVKGLRI